MSAVELLQDLLRQDTTNPPGNEEPAADVLRSYLEDAGLKTHIERSPEGRVNLIAKLEGPADKPALVLLSHTDVVAVERDRWSRDPWSGDISDGAIWGRGALDMKGIAALHAEAAARLAQSGQTPRREVIVCAVADEEAGGEHGASHLVDEHPELVGLDDKRPPPEVLGEGAFGLSGIVDRPLMPVVLGEKSALWLNLIARGKPGHGSLPPRDQAVMNLLAVVGKVSGYTRPRVHDVMREQFEILGQEVEGPRRAVFKALASGARDAIATALAGPLRSAGAVGALLSDTLTPTQVQAGYKHNVVPGEARASFDCRLLPDTDFDSIVNRVKKAATKRSVEVEVAGRHRGPVSNKGPLYSILERASKRLPSNPIVVPSLTAGFTDLRYFRTAGASGYGWVPIVLAPELLETIHGDDERVPEDQFDAGVAAMSEAVLEAAT